MKKSISLLCAALVLLSCGNKQDNSTDTESSKSKSLVVYYSQTGATEQVAKIIAQSTGADLDSIVPVNAYSGSFDETIARCQEEMANGSLPELKSFSLNVADYDTIYVGTPVWFGTVSQPVASWLNDVDLSGKVVIPFCTFGSGGLNTATDAMKTAEPDAIFVEGYGVRNARVAKASEEIEEFLIRRGIKSGDVPELAPFSEQQPLTADEQTIYDEACGSYPMPLGTPVTVAKRAIVSGTEYLYITESQDAQGNATKAQIYVTVSGEEGVAPEFTQAVR